MFARKNTSDSLLREAFRAEFSAVTHQARHAARKHSRWTAAIVATVAAGGIAAAGTAAPWASAATTPAADAHAVPGTGSHAQPVSHAELTSRAVIGKSAVPLPGLGGTSSAQPAAQQPGKATSHPAHASGKLAVGHAAAAKPAASSKHAAVTHAAATPAPSKPFTFYDSVSPSGVPAGKPVAVYSNGSYQTPSSAVAGHGQVLWIDVNGSNIHANALDVEPGDATPAGAASWVSAKLTADPNSNAIVYTFKSDWGAVISSISGLPAWMQSHVKYWIADPTGSPHILPGAAATQWYWGPNYDISSAAAGFTK